jgi:hypothetical protein
MNPDPNLNPNQAPAPIAGVSPTPGDYLSRGFTSVAQVR